MGWLKKWWWTVPILAIALVIGWEEERCQAQAYQCRASYAAQAQSERASGSISVDQQAAENQAIAAACEPNGYFCRLFGAANLPAVLLVLIGIGGIYAALRTLSAINRQAGTMERQTAATEKAAEAAKVSSDALLASERAWLIVAAQVPRNMQKHEYVRVSNNMLGVDQLSWGFGFDWSMKNCGKSAAFITRMGARFHSVSSLEELPKEPDIEIPDLYPPTAHFPHGLSISPDETINRFIFSKEKQPTGDERQKVADGTVIWVGYGIVEYRTVFSGKETHCTRFCYIWRPGRMTDTFERSDRPEGYTKQT